VTDSIDELAAIVRAGLDKDQRDAEKHACALDCLRATAQDWHQVRNDRHRAGTMQALRSVDLGNLGQDIPGHPGRTGHGIHYVGMRGTAMDPARVLAEVGAKRALLDHVLGWEHHHWPGVSRCEADAFPGERCTCGRDTRVQAVLTLLAQPYQETT
jgi:hypothetical protein